MACVASAGRERGHWELDERGAVYVEFLIVFMPVFLFFLGICQIALFAAARFVVQHAANGAARSAIVVLESDPNEFACVERGWVSRGSGAGPRLPERLLRTLGLGMPGTTPDYGGSTSALMADNPCAPSVITGPQQGARMAPIRFAAYVPLAVLAPPSAWLESQRPTGSLGDALSVSTRARLASALLYNRAGAVVTLQAGPGLDDLVPEPIGRKEPVTVRVTYLYYCSIPIVRSLACKSLADLTGKVWPGVPDMRSAAQKRLAYFLGLAEDPNLLARLDADGARFAVLTAESTLPNQGAAYY